jgi:hypothetical protein
MISELCVCFKLTFEGKNIDDLKEKVTVETIRNSIITNLKYLPRGRFGGLTYKHVSHTKLVLEITFYIHETGTYIDVDRIYRAGRECLNRFNPYKCMINKLNGEKYYFEI